MDDGTRQLKGLASQNAPLLSKGSSTRSLGVQGFMGHGTWQLGMQEADYVDTNL